MFKKYFFTVVLISFFGLLMAKEVVVGGHVKLCDKRLDSVCFSSTEQEGNNDRVDYCVSGSIYDGHYCNPDVIHH